MRVTHRLLLAFGLCLLAAACSLPRGAAVKSEILSQETSENPTFQVVRVTRENTPALAHWPVTGWAGHYHWFSADRGPDSSVIQTGDSLEIVIWDNQENSLLSGGETKVTPIPTMTVGASGNIFMPYVGDVPVRGLTRDAARRRLQTKIESIAPSAQVQLAVTPGRNNSVDMVGGVGSPGQYPLENRNTKILSVIAKSGGIAPSLRHPLVRLQRAGRTYETRAETLLADAGRNVRLRAGDQITVVEDTRSFNVLGAAGSEQNIYFTKEKMSAMEALSEMGGLSDGRANPKGILILREYSAKHLKPGMGAPDMQQVVFTLNLTSADGLFAARQFEINPGDTLLATESPVTAAQTIFGLVGSVIGFSAQTNNL